MEDRIIIGVDTGNRCIKTTHFSFLSGVKTYNTKPPIGNDIIEFKDNFYALTTERVSYLEDKTETEDYFVLSLFAIAKELEYRKVPKAPVYEIDLAVGLPPSHIARLQNEFIKYFKRSLVKYTYNDVEYVITIKNVFLFPQGYAAIIPQYDKIREIKKSYIIDIGGYTTDVIQLNNGLPDMSFCESLPFGIIELFNEIKRRFKTEYGRIPDENQIDEVLKSGTEIYQDMSKRIIEIATEYTNDMLRSLYEMGVDLLLSNAIFIGGGSIRLEQFINNSPYVNKKIVIKNINSNAIGYEMLAENCR